MLSLLIFIGFVGFVTFAVWSLISRIKKSGKAKRNLIISGVSFLVMVVAASFAPTPSKDLAVGPASTPYATAKATGTPKPTEDVTAKKATEDKAKADADAKAKKDAEDKQKADDAAKAKADEEAKTKADAEAQKKKDQQDVVLKFEQQIYDTEKPATLAIKTYQGVFQKFSDGSATINDAYEAVSNANKACKNVQYAMGTLSTPSGLPDDVEKSLSGATNDISTSYFTTSEALDQIMKYLDDQKPSFVQNYKDSMNMANSFIISGSQKILEAKMKMGINITASSPST